MALSQSPKWFELWVIDFCLEEANFYKRKVCMFDMAVHFFPDEGIGIHIRSNHGKLTRFHVSNRAKQRLGVLGVRPTVNNHLPK